MRISDWSSDVCSSDLLAATKLAGLAYRARLPAATLLAAFLILHPCLKAALRHVLVDLGEQHLVTWTYHVHRCFLATLERAQHGIDHTIIDQRLQATGDFH